MNLARLHQKLMSIARRQPVDQAVPPGFEKRAMARLTSLKPPDEWLFWLRALWTAAGTCALVAGLMVAWSCGTPPANADADLAQACVQELEQAILAAPAEDAENPW